MDIDDDEDEEWLRQAIASAKPVKQPGVKGLGRSSGGSNGLGILQGLRALQRSKSGSSAGSGQFHVPSSPESQGDDFHDTLNGGRNKEPYQDDDGLVSEAGTIDVPMSPYVRSGGSPSPSQRCGSPALSQRSFDRGSDHGMATPRRESIHSLKSEPMARTRPRHTSPPKPTNSQQNNQAHIKVSSPTPQTTTAQTTTRPKFTMRKPQAAVKSNTITTSTRTDTSFAASSRPTKREASRSQSLSKHMDQPTPAWSNSKAKSIKKGAPVIEISDDEQDEPWRNQIKNSSTTQSNTHDDLSDDDDVSIFNQNAKTAALAPRKSSQKNHQDKHETEEEIVLISDAKPKASDKMAKSVSEMMSGLELSADQHKMLPEQFKSLGAHIPGLNVALLEHQVVGVKFLLTRENPKQKFRGGLLCDDMGLGKTIQSLGMILLNPCNVKVDQGANQVSKTTLVVAPLALIGQWEQEVMSKTGLKCMIYHGSKRNVSVTELSKYDVVVTTYQTVRTDHSVNGPLLQVHWWRVICDESHLIKSKSSKTAQAVYALSAQLRWCLTGTPVQNSIDELYSFFKFIRVSPFDNFVTWRAQISRPINAGQAPLAYEKLHKLLAVLMLRRTKALFETGAIKLPERRVHRVYLDFNEHERQFYDELRASIRRELKDAESDRNPYLKMLTLLLRLRQACDDPAIVPSTAEGYATDDQELPTQNELEDPLRLDEHDSFFNEDGGAAGQGFFTPRRNKQDVRNVTRSFSSLSIEHRYPTKIDQIMNILLSSGSRKTIIYTQFSGMLASIETALRTEGVRFKTFHGAMAHAQRQQSLDEFKNDSSIQVFLCSLKAASLGLNLTCASQIILVDPWWNETVSNQAIDRVHRIGQTQAVDVYELLIKDSVEEAIIQLQQLKSTLSSNAIGGGRGVINDNSAENSSATAKLSKDELLALLRL